MSDQEKDEDCIVPDLSGNSITKQIDFNDGTPEVNPIHGMELPEVLFFSSITNPAAELEGENCVLKVTRATEGSGGPEEVGVQYCSVIVPTRTSGGRNADDKKRPLDLSKGGEYDDVVDDGIGIQYCSIVLPAKSDDEGRSEDEERNASLKPAKEDLSDDDFSDVKDDGVGIQYCSIVVAGKSRAEPQLRNSSDLSPQVNSEQDAGSAKADSDGEPGLKKQKLDLTNVELENRVAGQGDAPNVRDEESYLNRKEFTSEIYKIELINISRNCGYTELKKLVNDKLHLNGHKFKLTSTTYPQVFINFKNEEDKEKALETLNGYSFRGQVLKAKHAEAAPDPLVQRQQLGKSSSTSTGSDGTKTDAGKSIEKLVVDATIPWASYAYTVQLQKKQEEVLKVMNHLTREIYQANLGIDSHVKRLKDPSTNYPDLICSLDDILKSPVVECYRNKSEFTIGVNPDTGKPTVGFRISSYNQGSLSVGPVNDLCHLPILMVQGAVAFEDFISGSIHSCYDPLSHVGVWKQLTVRTTEEGELMLYPLISADGLSKEEVLQIQTDLKYRFEASENLDVTSFYLKEAEKHGVSVKNEPVHLFGNTTITENLFGLKLRISPDAFFQVNTKATEVMYSAISSMAGLDDQTTLLDICCGTGAIGLSCLKLGRVGEVLGVDWTPAAIVDAKINADENGLADKCQFFCGKAEDLLSILIGKAKFPRVVAIVDPPRSGLHASVIQTLRNTRRIKSLIYVACNARSAMQNFVDLAKPISKRFRGEPFRPVMAIPVDMFPHTPHFELILAMERVES